MHVKRLPVAWLLDGDATNNVAKVRQTIWPPTAQVRAAQMTAYRAANEELLRLYRVIGQTILDQQAAAGWGGKIIDKLGADLRQEFPGMSGLARSNLYYMRAFAAAWPDGQVVPRPVGQLPWRMVRCLLDKLSDRTERDWYAGKAVENSWSLPVLEHHIATGLHGRLGVAPSNFVDRLPAADSDLAQEITKDPYVFDFLSMTERAAERDLEQAMMNRLQQTLLEFGSTSTVTSSWSTCCCSTPFSFGTWSSSSRSESSSPSTPANLDFMSRWSTNNFASPPSMPRQWEFCCAPTATRKW